MTADPVDTSLSTIVQRGNMNELRSVDELSAVAVAAAFCYRGD